MLKFKYKRVVKFYLGKLFPFISTSVKRPERYSNTLKGKKGLEIGGPSKIFEDYGDLPVYKHIQSLDCSNFGNSTIWEGSLKEGPYYRYNKNKTGYQYIKEASNLIGIQDETYDFLLSSHCLEHCANAIKTLNEWKRVIKYGGYLLIIVPDRFSTFDHKRPLTTFQHFADDFKKNVEEDDLTHLEEILKNHDLSIDKSGGSLEQFAKRSENNIENRCLHHHTFDLKNLTELLTYVNFTIVEKEFHKPFHNIILARKE